MILEKYSKEVYEYFLDKGCINYYDLNKIESFSNNHILALKQLLDDKLITIEEIDFSPFLILNQSNILKVDNINKFKINVDSLKESVDSELKKFRKERNIFLKYIHENIIVEHSQLVAEYGSLFLQKFCVYIKNYDLSNLNLFSLSIMGCKVLNKKFNLNEIEYRILKYILNNNIKIKNKRNTYLYMIESIQYLKQDLFISYKASSDYENRKISKMKSFGLVDYLYGYNTNIIYLTEKGFNLNVKERCEDKTNYTDYIKKLDLKLNNMFKDEYIPFNECLFFNKFLEHKILNKQELNMLSKKATDFIIEYVSKIDIFGEVYLCLNNKFYQKYKIVNRKHIFTDIIDYIKQRDVNISEHFSLSKIFKMLNKIFAFNLPKKIETNNGLKFKHWIKFKNSYSLEYTYNLAILYIMDMVEYTNINDNIYIFLTEKGWDYLELDEKLFVKDDSLEEIIDTEKQNKILLDIYDNHFIAKSKLEKTYGKNTLEYIKEFIDMFRLNNYTYIQLNKLGCTMIAKKYKNNKGTIIHLPQKFTIKKENISKIIDSYEKCSIVDEMDKYILNLINTNKLIRKSDLEPFNLRRVQKLITMNYINSCTKYKYLALTETGCNYINKKYFEFNSNCLLNISKKERVAKSYFVKKQIALEEIDLIGNLNVIDKEEIISKCESFLNTTSTSLDNKYNREILSENEEKILYTMYVYDLHIDKFSINKTIYDKLKNFKYLKTCRNTKYAQLSESYKQRAFIAELLEIKPFDLINTDDKNCFYFENTSIFAERNVDKFKNIDLDKRKSVNVNGVLQKKGKKSLSKKLYADNVNYLFGGVQKNNIKKHINFLKNEKYIVFDTEFGSEYGHHSNMIEISAIKVDGLKIIDKIDFLVKDHKRSLCRRTRELTRIDKELLCEKGVSEKYALNRFIEFTEGLPVLAHAADNDWHSCVLLGCDNNGIELPKNKIIDSFELLTKIYPKEKCGLDAMISKFNLKDLNIPRHRALGDSIYTFEIIKRVVARYSSKEHVNVYNNVV